MTANIDTDTGIPYGIIKCDAIHPEVLDDLLYRHGKDLNYQPMLDTHLFGLRAAHNSEMEEKRIARAELDGGTLSEDEDTEFDEAKATEEFNDGWQPEEPVIGGQYEGVTYRTTWLGGAQMLYVFKSPVLTKCSPCSPCVPNAGDLDSVGDYLAYGVPVDWLDTQYVHERIGDAGYWIFPYGDKFIYSYGPTVQQIPKATWGSADDAAVGCYKEKLQTDAPCEDEGCTQHGTTHICNPEAGS
jgi:hypothetical protein